MGFKVALNSIISWEPEAGVALGFNILTPSLTRLEILPCVAIGKYYGSSARDSRGARAARKLRPGRPAPRCSNSSGCAALQPLALDLAGRFPGGGSRRTSESRRRKSRLAEVSCLLGTAAVTVAEKRRVFTRPPQYYAAYNGGKLSIASRERERERERFQKRLARACDEKFIPTNGGV